jgi:sec-independent protein translocase protein TatA
LIKRQSKFQNHTVSLFIKKEKDFFIIINQKNMDSMFLIFGLGGQEMFFVLIIVLLLFGGNKIPELMRGLGRGVKEFNNAKANVEDEIRKGMSEIDPKKAE